MFEERLSVHASAALQLSERHFEADVEAAVVGVCIEERCARPAPVGPDVVCLVVGRGVGGRVVPADGDVVAQSFGVGFCHLSHENCRALVLHHLQDVFEVEAAHHAPKRSAYESADNDAEVVCLFCDEQHLGFLLFQLSHHGSDVCLFAGILNAGYLNDVLHFG